MIIIDNMVFIAKPVPKICFKIQGQEPASASFDAFPLDVKSSWDDRIAIGTACSTWDSVGRGQRCSLGSATMICKLKNWPGRTCRDTES